jgi:hypothetical protein
MWIYDCLEMGCKKVEKKGLEKCMKKNWGDGFVHFFTLACNFIGKFTCQFYLKLYTQVVHTCNLSYLGD